MFDNDNIGNSGNKSKWNERLSKMRISRLKIKRKYVIREDDFTFKDIVRDIFKIILVIPSVVYTNLKANSNKESNDVKNKLNINKDINDCKNIFINSKTINKDNYNCKVKNTNNIGDSYIDKKRVEEIKKIDVSLLGKNRYFLLKKLGLINNNLVISSVDVMDIEKRKQELKKEIINLIQKNLVKSINEFEILQSEFYVLNNLENVNVYLSECEHDVKEVKNMLAKIKLLKEKYDYLKDNVDFEYMLEYSDDYLVDKILEFKDICTRTDIFNTVDDYKLLDEFKFLYLKVDKFQEKLIKYEEYKIKRAEELKQRDIDFEKLILQLYNVDREQEKYNDFVKKQEILLNELNDKIGIIDSYEVITHKLKGFNQLLTNSFKYLGLLLVNPLKGVIPGVVTQTLITKNLIKNLYNNLECNEEKKMVYESIDYSSLLENAIKNLDDVSSLVDSSLEDILLLKNKYINEFSHYELSFSSYKDVISKLNEMENIILGNKLKVENMKNKAKEKIMQNEKKLKMVKILNDSSNNN